MLDLIQTIQILSPKEVKDLNEYIDTLEFRTNAVFDQGDNCVTRQDVRNSTGCTLNEDSYLTNDFEGGRTLFTHKEFKPLPGHALIFPSNWCFPHCGETVTSGKKRVAVTWYYVERQ